MINENMQENIPWNNDSNVDGNNDGNRDSGPNNVFSRTNDTISSFENVLGNNSIQDSNIDIQHATTALLYPLARGFELLMNITPLQRQQLLSAAIIYQQQQQQITEIILKQQKLALSRAMAVKSYNENMPLNSIAYNNNNGLEEPEDEISKSLKMFAMLTSHKNIPNFGNSNTNVTSTACNMSPIDAVMQDFANNGCVSDDINFQITKNNTNNNMVNYNKSDIITNKRNKGNFYCNATHMGPWTQQNNLPTTTLLQGAPSNVNAVYNQYYQQQQRKLQQQQRYIALQQQLNVNFNNNLLNIAPPSIFGVQQQQQHLNNHLATSATATAVSSAYNVIDFHNPLNNNRKFMKRSGGTKKDKYVQRCVFCENNNEPEAVVKSHAVRDTFGKVLCPKLRIYVCPICKASGDHAHTIKYCPKKRIITMEDVIKSEGPVGLTKNQFSKHQ